MARPKTVPFSVSIDPAPVMKVWHLVAKDINEPPFYYANVARRYVVAAITEENARHHAALHAAAHGPVWLDRDMTDCAELAPSEPGVIAHMAG